MKSNPLDKYQQTKVKTAGQGQIIVMLYNEALKQLDIANFELGSSSPRLDRAHNAIIKTREILTELTVSLDFEKGGNIARNLFNLYVYFNQQLMESNLKKDPSSLKEIHRLMSDLRDAWATVEGTVRQNPKEIQSEGVNLAG